MLMRRDYDWRFSDSDRQINISVFWKAFDWYEEAWKKLPCLLLLRLTMITFLCICDRRFDSTSAA